MNKIIVLAGATGNLGQKICYALLKKGATVKALVRPESNTESKKALEMAGAQVHEIDYSDMQTLAGICIDAHCVVSALSGLREVIIDTQTQLLHAAIAAGVKRFIPSDYSLDFTNFKAGENRNLDWRREFHTYLDAQAIAPTSIFNGAFMDMLKGPFPMILFEKKRIMYWGDSRHEMGFTMVKDTAQFTACAALDESTPRYLRISGQSISPRDLMKLMSSISQTPYKLMRLGGPKRLLSIIKIIRFISPKKNSLYPIWQSMQYMSNMIDQRASLKSIDNNRYPEINWTRLKDFLLS